jgi:Xaa-Pro aminopeptidase
MAQAVRSALPALSVQERDRRYALIRADLRERGVDCAIVFGSNLFYLSNGIPGERGALLPAADLPLTVAVNGRHLVDVPASVIIDAQDWVEDVKGANDLTPLIARIKELRLERGALGLANKNMPLDGYQQLRKELPDAKLVDVSDVFANIRTIKSAEEMALLARASRVFDAGIERMYERVKPGMTGFEAVREGVQGMWAAGGDLDSAISFNFGAVPKQNPVLADLCLTRAVGWGDIGTLTGHSEYAHYAGHSDQEISFGEPSARHRDMFAAVLHVRDTVLKHVKPGATHRELVDAYRQACDDTGFRSSVHSQMHQYGIDVPEHPGPRFRIMDSGGSGAPGRLGAAGDFTLASGMIYSISPTLIAPNGEDTLLGGTSLAVTDTGYQDLSERKVEMLVVA